MILTFSEPFSKEQIGKLRQAYDVYIKTVIDIQKKVCSAGCVMHYESEKILLDQGSSQPDIWGGGIDIETKTIDFNSFINIRPAQQNTSNEIQDPYTREVYQQLTQFFFREIL